MYVKNFIVNVNKRLKPFFLEQHINIVNRVTLQSFWYIFTCYTTTYSNNVNRRKRNSASTLMCVELVRSKVSTQFTSTLQYGGICYHTTYASQSILYAYIFQRMLKYLIFTLTVPRRASLVDPFCYCVFRVCLLYAVLSVPCSLLVKCRKRPDVLALLCVMFSCVLFTFPYDVLGQVPVWYLIVSIPDLCLLRYHETALHHDETIYFTTSSEFNAYQM